MTAPGKDLKLVPAGTAAILPTALPRLIKQRGNTMNSEKRGPEITGFWSIK